MELLWPFPGNKTINPGFNQMRPLSVPPEKRWHIHGAGDIPGQKGSIIMAPEDGTVAAYRIVRDSKYKGAPWPDNRMDNFPFRDYGFDVYGGMVVLKGKSGMVHLFCHQYWEQLKDGLYVDDEWGYTEQSADDQYPYFSDYTTFRSVKEGERIGKIGNSGYTFGPHCHYEIHPSYRWYDYKDRVDPETIKWRNRV